MRLAFLPALALAALTVAGTAALAAPGRLAPIPRDQEVSSHGPFQSGDCDTCHASRDPKNPGPAAVTNDTCFECHDEFKGKAPVKMEKSVHPKVTSATSCVGCHSPHNSRKKKLLLPT